MVAVVRGLVLSHRYGIAAGEPALQVHVGTALASRRVCISDPPAAAADGQVAMITRTSMLESPGQALVGLR
jgi:hypothetical protein